jgi:hypothetical protein
VHPVAPDPQAPPLDPLLLPDPPLLDPLLPPDPPLLLFPEPPPEEDDDTFTQVSRSWHCVMLLTQPRMPSLHFAHAGPHVAGV